MALTLFRRHTARCKGHYNPTDRHGKDCDCYVHVEGKLGEEFIRSSTFTRSWVKAAKLVREAEHTKQWRVIRDEPDEAEQKAPTIQDAIASFIQHLTDHTDSNLKPATMTKYRTILRRLAAFCDSVGLQSVDEIDRAVLLRFRETWRQWTPPIGINSAGMYVVRVRRFGDYCAAKQWWKENHAKIALRMPKNFGASKRLPFSAQEMERIFAAAQEQLDPDVHTFIELMYETGMAISDAALLESNEIEGTELHYWRNKQRDKPNAKEVIQPLSSELSAKLHGIKQRGLCRDRYYFCRGADSLHGAFQYWYQRLLPVFEAAGIKGCPSHRFRHTFAKRWLMDYAPVEMVAMWLGNDAKTVLKYYSNWIKERLDRASSFMAEKRAGGSD